MPQVGTDKGSEGYWRVTGGNNQAAKNIDFVPVDMAETIAYKAELEKRFKEQHDGGEAGKKHFTFEEAQALEDLTLPELGEFVRKGTDDIAPQGDVLGAIDSDGKFKSEKAKAVYFFIVHGEAKEKHIKSNASSTNDSMGRLNAH